MVSATTGWHRPEAANRFDESWQTSTLLKATSESTQSTSFSPPYILTLINSQAAIKQKPEIPGDLRRPRRRFRRFFAEFRPESDSGHALEGHRGCPGQNRLG